MWHPALWSVADKEITTIEGLRDTRASRIRLRRRGVHAEQAMQCGYAGPAS